ncbi:MAG TPA: HEPN domain-containing protein [Candidatus Methanoperedens sp.]
MGTFALYNAFFHVARALLFKDGIKERSHFCIARYVEEKYVNTKLLNRDFLDYLDTLRDARHETQYSLDFVEIEMDLHAGIVVCREFMKVVDVLIK